MKELMGGYCENPALAKKGPRIKKDALENWRKNRGSCQNILGFFINLLYLMMHRLIRNK